ncbi:MAG: VCBS domain-containing protein, partial [Pseudomonas sp.]
TLTLTGTNDDPVISGTADNTADLVQEDSDLTATGTLASTDVDHNATATWSIQGDNDSDGTVTGTYGSLALDSTGTWIYTLANGTDGVASAVQSLAAGETVTDTFTVRVTDDKGGFDEQTVTVTITGTNDLPSISGDAIGAVAEDTSIPTLTDTGTLTIDDLDTDQSNFQTTGITASSGALGNLTITSAGVWTYNVANSAVQYLGEGETKVETFTVLSADGTTHDIVVTITGTNDVPTIAGDAVGAVTEDTGVVAGNLTDTGSLTINDLDAGQSSFQTTGITANGSVLGSLTITSAGVWTYSVANSAVQYLKAGETKVETFTVLSTDGTPRNVVVTITGTNDVPTIAGDAVGAVTEDTGVVAGNLTDTGSLTINDLDAGQSSFQTTGITASPGALGSLTITAAGVWSYNVANSAVQYLGAGETKVETFTVRSIDGTTHDIAVTITGTNDAPTVTALTAGAAEDDTSFDLNLLTGANDVDTGTVLSISNVQGLANGLTLNGSTLTVNPAHADFQSLAEGVTRDIVISYDVIDGNGGVTPQTATITITGTNDAPVIQSAYTNIDGQGSITKAQGLDNHSLAKAVSLDGQFVLGSDSDVGNSQTVPFVSISATGANAYDYYSFTVTQAGTATFDIDYAREGGFDSTL